MSNVILAGQTFQARRARFQSMIEAVRDVNAIALRIKRLRESREWSQAQAYRACQIEKTTWNNYEQAVSRPRLDEGARICEVFGVDLNYLYTGSTAGLSAEALDRLFGTQA